MSKLDRLDIAIGILDHTENEIKRIKNQHKFEKDLREFLNTNAYSKDKYWVAGMLNQVSKYCKDKIDTLIEKDQRIAELEEQLKNTIKLPCKIDDIVYWVDWDNTIKYGKVFEITVHIDGIRVHTGTRYCLKASKIFLTYKEAEANLEKFQKEAQAKLEELKGE